MKKLIYIFSIVFVLITFTGCATNDYRINYKQDKNADYGYAAMVYDGNIYYVSDELGEPGLYRMELDGSNVKLEVKDSHITGLQGYENDIFYTGFYKKTPANMFFSRGLSSTDHSIYRYANGSKQPTNFVEYGKNCKYFWITQNGYSAICLGAMNSYYDFNTSEMETIEELSEYELGEIDFRKWMPEEESYTRNYMRGIYAFDDLILFVDKATALSHVYEFFDVFAFDMEKNDIIPFHEKNLFYVNEDSYIFAYKGLLFWADRETFEVVRKMDFDPESLTREIVNIIPYRDELYIAVEYIQKTSDPWQIVYRINQDGTKCEEMIALEDEAYLYGFWEDFWILYYDNGLYLQKIGEKDFSEATLLYKYKNLKKIPHVIDYAGDWMFLYESSIGFTYDHLREEDASAYITLLSKINLRSKEIVYEK